MTRKYVSWTKALVKQEALKYKHKSDFKMNSASAYNCAHRNGWVSEVCAHMVPKIYTNTKWTLELMMEEAKKYTRKIDFRINSKAAYDSACRRGLIGIVCAHMEKR